MKFLFFFLLVGAYGFNLHQKCNTDQDCSQPNTYCYQSRICANCSNCTLFNRLPGRGCAKDKNQCGECLSGMVKDIHLDGTTFTCTLPDKIPPNIENPEKLSTGSIVIISVVAIIGFTAICVIIALCINKKLRGKAKKYFLSNNPMNTSENARPEEPPPYSVSPTAPLEEESPPIYQKVYQHVENEPSQTANAYSNPQYIRGGDLEINEQQEEQQEEQDVSEADALLTSTSITHPDDEETQPSNWTPTTTRSETGSITGPTTFEAAFSTFPQLTISQPDVSNQQITTYRSNSHPNFEFSSQTSNNDNSSDANNSQNVHNQIGVNISINLNMSN